MEPRSGDPRAERMPSMVRGSTVQVSATVSEDEVRRSKIQVSTTISEDEVRGTAVHPRPYPRTKTYRGDDCTVAIVVRPKINVKETYTYDYHSHPCRHIEVLVIDDGQSRLIVDAKRSGQFPSPQLSQ